VNPTEYAAFVASKLSQPTYSLSTK